jgi:hypothetical protein
MAPVEHSPCGPEVPIVAELDAVPAERGGRA